MDLTIVMGSFAYMEDWIGIVEKIAKISKYFFVGEYVPKDPIGMVKSKESLCFEFDKFFDMKEKLELNNEHIFLFGKSRLYD